MRSALLALLLIATAAWAELGPLHKEDAGKFEFRPPAGWKVMEFGGLKYKIHHAAAKDGFAPNMNFMEEAFAGDFKDYPPQAMRMVETMMKAKITAQPVAFKLDSGLPCSRSVFEANQQGRDLRFISFLNRLDDKKVVIATFTSLLADSDKWDASVAESIRTFAQAK